MPRVGGHRAQHAGMDIRHTLKAHRGFIVFLLGFALFRTAVADWNPIPSASMRPTLREGDVVLVNRLAYDLKLPLTDLVLLPLGEPRRCDVVTLSSPVDGTRLIKRIVGLPGDRIAMRGDVLFLNGEPAGYTGVESAREALQATETLAGRAHAVQFLPAAFARRDFDEITVPAGHYFLLGDNRDNSADSRYIGPVPRELLIGRAHHVLVAMDWLGEDGRRFAPRFGRFFSAIR